MPSYYFYCPKCNALMAGAKMFMHTQGECPDCRSVVEPAVVIFPRLIKNPTQVEPTNKYLEFCNDTAHLKAPSEDK